MVTKDKISYSPSAVDTFTDCNARHWFTKHKDGSGELTCDGVAASVSIALHEAAMQLGREAVVWHKRGKVPPIADASQVLRRMVNQALFRNQVDASAPAVAQRLGQAQPGLDLLAELVVSETTGWVCDPSDGLPLVWHEQWLDSGERYAGVAVMAGVSARTRADTIGVRPGDGAPPRVVIRDHKAKRNPVNPRFDNGILIRSIWAADEIADPRCSWFLQGRGVQVDPDVLELETVNLLHGGNSNFIVRAQVGVHDLLPHRERLADIMAEMAAVEAEASVEFVSASPSALCKDYCPFLHRCTAGQQFVAGSYGSNVLSERLNAA